MDTAQWPQGIVMKPMDEIIVQNPNNNIINKKATCSTSSERKIRPQKEQALNCPRCNSTNTKFCYYNNYSLSQPRYFCKTCRRYWTEGGSLRNIPVGGGSRKNKRSSFSSSSSSLSSSILSPKISTDLIAPQSQLSLLNSNPKIHPHHNHQGQDLNLGFPPNHDQNQEFRTLSEFIQLPVIENPPKTHHMPNSSDNVNTSHLSALELLNGLTSSRGLAPFSPMSVHNNHDPNVVYSSGFGLHDFKPTLNFSLDGISANSHGYGSLQGVVDQQDEDQANNNGRLLFPFEDLKPVSSNTSTDNPDNNSTVTTTNTTTATATANEHGNSTGYWTGLLGTGASW